MIWTHDADDTLRTLKQQGKTDAEIAQVLGTSKSVVLRRRARLGIQSPLVRLWTDQDMETLRKLCAAGYSDVDISYIMSRDRMSVRHYRRQLGLPANGKPGGCRPTRDKTHRERISEGLRKFWRDRPDREEAAAASAARLKGKGARGRRNRGPGYPVLPPRGTPAYRLYEKIRSTLGKEAARTLFPVAKPLAGTSD